MSQPEGTSSTPVEIIEQARAAGLRISDSHRQGEWWLDPHGITLNISRSGRLLLSGATGHGFVVESVDDLLFFVRDPEAAYRELGARDWKERR
jgi:hypothetical protein